MSGPKGLDDVLDQVLIYSLYPVLEQVFVLDGEHSIEAGRVFPVCGNTLAMLKDTRFAPYFDVIGDGTTHYGLFPGCAAPDVFAATTADEAPASPGGCCG